MIVGLENKIVVVTGAASGIGAAIAKEAADAGVAGLLLNGIPSIHGGPRMAS